LKAGKPELSLTQNLSQAEAYLEKLAKMGVELDDIMHTLQADHLAMAEAQYLALIEAVTQRLFTLGMAA
jgi:hypothetical protein